MDIEIYIIQHVCMSLMGRISVSILLLSSVLASVAVGVRIEKGFLTLDVVTGDNSQ